MWSFASFVVFSESFDRTLCFGCVQGLTGPFSRPGMRGSTWISRVVRIRIRKKRNFASSRLCLRLVLALPAGLEALSSVGLLLPLLLSFPRFGLRTGTEDRQ